MKNSTRGSFGNVEEAHAALRESVDGRRKPNGPPDRPRAMHLKGKDERRS